MPYVSAGYLRASLSRLRRDAIFTDLLAMRYLAPDREALDYFIESPTAAGSLAARACEALGSVLPAECDPGVEGWRLHECYGRMDQAEYYLYLPFAAGAEPKTPQSTWRKGDYNRSGLQRRFNPKSRSPELQGGWVLYDPGLQANEWAVAFRDDWRQQVFQRLLDGRPIDYWAFCAWMLRYCPLPEEDPEGWATLAVAEQLRLPEEVIADDEETAIERSAWFHRGDAPPEGAFRAPERVRARELIELLGETDTERGFRLPGELGRVRREAAAGEATLQETLTDAGGGRRLRLDPDVLPALIAAVRLGKNVLLMGPPGTGKSTLARNAIAAAQAGLFPDVEPPADSLFTTATAGWTTFDTIGGYVPRSDGAGLEFRPGVFLEAFAGNRWTVVDELNRADVDKAFGQLLTVLSEVDTAVELPYVVHDRAGGGAGQGEPRRIQVMPSRRWDDRDPDAGLYAVPPDWRLIGTMNTFDKNSLFTLSYAFMRRFAVVYVDALSAVQAADVAERATGIAGAASARLRRLLESAEEVGRPLGPAIAIDVARLVLQRAAGGAAVPGGEEPGGEAGARQAAPDAGAEDGEGGAGAPAAEGRDAPAAEGLPQVGAHAATDAFLEATVAFVIPQMEGLEPEHLVRFMRLLIDGGVVPAHLDEALRRRFEQLLGLPT